MKKILFIYSTETATYPLTLMLRPIGSPEFISFGISYISSLLKNHGHQTDLLVLSSSFGKKSWSLINRRLHLFSPDLVCFSAVSSQYPFITKVAKHIKSHHPELFLLIGGPHVSLNAKEAISDVYDAACVGEGEYPTLELVSALDSGVPPSKIQNLWIKKDGLIEKNSQREFLQDLNDLPYPDRQMWFPALADCNPGRFSVLLGRGCPFNCTYCSNHALRRLASGRYVRWRSQENIVQEISWIHEQFSDVREFYLEVETFNVNREWALTLCERLKEFNGLLSSPLEFGVNLRLTAQAKIDDFFPAFKAANIRYVNIGLESGCERVRKKILKRDYSNKMVIESVNSARIYGIKVALYNLIGIPGETFSDFRETIHMNRICQPDWHFTSIFYPYPGTDLYYLCLKKGYLSEKTELSRERYIPTLDLPGFNKKDIQRSFTLFDYFVYRRRRPLIYILLRVFHAKAKSNRYFEWFYTRFRYVYLKIDNFIHIRKLLNEFLGEYRKL